MDAEIVNPQFEQAMHEYLDVAIELERAEYQSDVEPFESYAAKLRQKLAAGLRKFQKTYAHGYQVLIEEFEKRHPGQDLTSYQTSFGNLQLFDDPTSFMKFFAQGKTVHDLLGFTSDAMVEFYEAASQLLEEGRFQDGLDAFFFLVTIAPNISEFWLDLGFAYSKLDQLQAAVDSYERAIDLDPKSADAYLALAGTLVRMQDFEQAMKTCDLGVQVASQNRGEAWAEELSNMLTEGKRQIEALFNKSQYGTFAS